MPTPEPAPPPRPTSLPGERPPDAERRRLRHAPAERYRPPTGGTGAPAVRGSAAGAVGWAAGITILGSAILTVILGVFTSTGGTFAVTLLASVGIGLRVSTAAVPPGRTTLAPLQRGTAIRIAAGLGVGMLVVTGIGVWLLARSEGGVLDPLTYLWTTFGAGLPVLAGVALVGAAWGAASGPIRWRS